MTVSSTSASCTVQVLKPNRREAQEVVEVKHLGFLNDAFISSALQQDRGAS
jgi:hypothetical protein